MKNIFKLFGIAVLVTVIGFSFISCGGGGGGGGGGNSVTYEGYDANNTYSLTITEAAGAAKYEAAEGDDYEFTVKGAKNGKSTGTVESITGSRFTLSRGGVVTVNNSGITNISGTINLDSGGTVTAGDVGTITAGKKPGTGPGGGGDYLPATSGRLTITGIPAKYNNKYIFGTAGDGANDLILIGGINESSSDLALVQIKGASVQLKIWEARAIGEDDVEFYSYNGSHQATFYFGIYDEAFFDEENINRMQEANEEFSRILEGMDLSNPQSIDFEELFAALEEYIEYMQNSGLEGMGTVDVKFSGGTGSAAFNDLGPLFDY